MKRPLIRDIDRWDAIKYPDSIAGAAVYLGIATARLKRDIGELLKPIFEPILNFLVKLLS